MDQPPASAPPAVMPVEENERSILSHLGLPFYYRHALPRGMRRAVFWSSFVCVLALLFINALYMPHGRDSFMHNLRVLLFGGGSGYHTYESGAQSIFIQLSVISLILSCVLAPVLATFSFSNERVLGTLEFLRLSPMSTVSIVLGKMFAPAYAVHLLSLTMLLLGCVFGYVGGTKPENLLMGVLVFVLATGTLHAVGAFCASLTGAYRGSAALGGLLGVGFMLSVPPMASMEERGYEFLSFISPWSTFDMLFWQAAHWQNRYANPVVFYGSKSLAQFYALAFHALTFGMLIWAASRKLDDPNRTALPRYAWAIIWLFILVSAVGLGINVQKYRMFRGWEDAAAITGIGCAGLCFLALIDHPHRRDIVLTNLCERLAGHERPPASLARMTHALFAAGLAACSAAVVVTFIWLANGLAGVSAGAVLFFSLVPVLIVFLIALVQETAAVGYETRAGQTVAGLAMGAVLAASMIAPVIHLAVISSSFHRAVWAYNWVSQCDVRIANLKSQEQSLKQQIAQLPPNSAQQLSALNSQLQSVQNSIQNEMRSSHYARQQLAELRRDPVASKYLEDIKTPKDAQMLMGGLGRDPIALLWRFHPKTLLFYPLFFLVVVVLVFFLRERAYRRLLREAQQAVAASAAGAASPAAATAA
jgi:ABC-type transport system involved in multi-copper enzyme maturation permease subunit